MSISPNQASTKQIKTKPASKQKISGVILIDKPMGMTSQQVVSKVKYLFKSPVYDSKKAGHTGTLDPMATGLLPICLGEATKFSHYQLDADKSYQATILLGAQTDTGDADGKITAEMAIPIFDQDLLESLSQQFLGAQQQIPPMYSALKKDGKKLYEYARAGIEVERAPRDIVLKAVTLTVIDERQIQLTVTCTKGTYVRVLAEDIAKALGTLGHLTALRRLQVGEFRLEEAITVAQLEEQTPDSRRAQLLPVDACVNIKAELMLTALQVERVRQGQRLNVFDQLTAELQDYILNTLQTTQLETSVESVVQNMDILDSNDREDAQGSLAPLLQHEQPVDIRLLNDQGQFIGLGAVSLNGRLQPKKLIQI
ncbi:tRNA pseudouridine(55) synthase TruB [Psychrobacter frigidicola]|uniref:tRNA pseudouridine synthase B n=1 Tax=Psychrobacter frigidicola TaxID=45611 RepID=A0A5C7A0F8_9GAMM|nr:tRNA pseudouridine(55) synthase TruB [Psychrobacter frigidicola]TXD96838.1 tRNA pseudouridine(55) synthase TruB [Psychrobacter frigidicola]